MKKVVLFLLVLMMVIVGVPCITIAAVATEKEEVVDQTSDAAPLLTFVQEVPVEQSRFCNDIPLTHEEQNWLQAACEEFEVPYALALGLIEKETIFRNIVGDDGASTGYM